MQCFYCGTKTEFFCLCYQRGYIVCERHASYHKNENDGVVHTFERIYHSPNLQEKINLAQIIRTKINNLEAVKANKIHQKNQEIEKILNELKSIVGNIDSDLSNLSWLLKKIFTANEISRIEDSVIFSLFNTSCEQVINILEVNGSLNFQNYIEKTKPNYHSKETQTANLVEMPAQLPFLKQEIPSNPYQMPTNFFSQAQTLFIESPNIQNPSYNPPIRNLTTGISTLQINESIQTNREMPISNAIWSKLTENGNFVPYDKAVSDIIESEYQKKSPFASIGGENSQCYIYLTYPILELQETTKSAVMVLRNNSQGIDESRIRFESWYYKGDKAWEEMTQEASRVAEWAYRKKYNTALVLGANKNSYWLDVTANMKQINCKTKRKRDIRRGNEPEKIEEVKEKSDLAKPIAFSLASRLAERKKSSSSSSSDSID